MDGSWHSGINSGLDNADRLGSFSPFDRLCAAIKSLAIGLRLRDPEILPVTFKLKPAAAYKRDEEGNTAAHVALQTRDVFMVVLDDMKFRGIKISNSKNNQGKTECDLFLEYFHRADLRESITAFMQAGGAITHQFHLTIIRDAYPDDELLLLNCQRSLDEFKQQLARLVKGVPSAEAGNRLGLPSGKTELVGDQPK